MSQKYLLLMKRYAQFDVHKSSALVVGMQLRSFAAGVGLDMGQFHAQRCVIRPDLFKSKTEYLQAEHRLNELSELIGTCITAYLLAQFELMCQLSATTTAAATTTASASDSTDQNRQQQPRTSSTTGMVESFQQLMSMCKMVHSAFEFDHPQYNSFRTAMRDLALQSTNSVASSLAASVAVRVSRDTSNSDAITLAQHAATFGPSHDPSDAITAANEEGLYVRSTTRTGNTDSFMIHNGVCFFAHDRDMLAFWCRHTVLPTLATGRPDGTAGICRVLEPFAMHALDGWWWHVMRHDVARLSRMAQTNSGFAHHRGHFAAAVASQILYLMSFLCFCHGENLQRFVDLLLLLRSLLRNTMDVEFSPLFHWSSGDEKGNSSSGSGESDSKQKSEQHLSQRNYVDEEKISTVVNELKWSLEVASSSSSSAAAPSSSSCRAPLIDAMATTEWCVAPYKHQYLGASSPRVESTAIGGAVAAEDVAGEREIIGSSRSSSADLFFKQQAETKQYQSTLGLFDDQEPGFVNRWRVTDGAAPPSKLKLHCDAHDMLIKNIFSCVNILVMQTMSWLDLGSGGSSSRVGTVGDSKHHHHENLKRRSVSSMYPTAVRVKIRRLLFLTLFDLARQAAAVVDHRQRHELTLMLSGVAEKWNLVTGFVEPTIITSSILEFFRDAAIPLLRDVREASAAAALAHGGVLHNLRVVPNANAALRIVTSALDMGILRSSRKDLTHDAITSLVDLTEQFVKQRRLESPEPKSQQATSSHAGESANQATVDDSSNPDVVGVAACRPMNVHNTPEKPDSALPFHRNKSAQWSTVRRIASLSSARLLGRLVGLSEARPNDANAACDDMSTAYKFGTYGIHLEREEQQRKLYIGNSQSATTTTDASSAETFESKAAHRFAFAVAQCVDWTLFDADEFRLAEWSESLVAEDTSSHHAYVPLLRVVANKIINFGQNPVWIGTFTLLVSRYCCAVNGEWHLLNTMLQRVSTLAAQLEKSAVNPTAAGAATATLTTTESANKTDVEGDDKPQQEELGSISVVQIILAVQEAAQHLRSMITDERLATSAVVEKTESRSLWDEAVKNKNKSVTNSNSTSSSGGVGTPFDSNSEDDDGDDGNFDQENDVPLATSKLQQQRPLSHRVSSRIDKVLILPPTLVEQLERRLRLIVAQWRSNAGAGPPKLLFHSAVTFFKHCRMVHTSGFFLASLHPDVTDMIAAFFTTRDPAAPAYKNNPDGARRVLVIPRNRVVERSVIELFLVMRFFVHVTRLPQRETRKKIEWAVVEYFEKCVMKYVPHDELAHCISCVCNDVGDMFHLGMRVATLPHKKYSAMRMEGLLNIALLFLEETVLRLQNGEVHPNRVVLTTGRSLERSIFRVVRFLLHFAPALEPSRKPTRPANEIVEELARRKRQQSASISEAATEAETGENDEQRQQHDMETLSAAVAWKGALIRDDEQHAFPKSSSDEDRLAFTAGSKFERCRKVSCTLVRDYFPTLKNDRSMSSPARRFAEDLRTRHFVEAQVQEFIAAFGHDPDDAIWVK